jgi:hypothetical protein
MKPRDITHEPFDGDALLETILERALTLIDDDFIRDPEFRAALGD